MTFAELVATEIKKARAKHRGVNSPHEGYAVIQEELDEFWDLVKSQSPSGYELLLELVQTAAMCQRTAEDTGLQERFGALLADRRFLNPLTGPRTSEGYAVAGLEPPQ